MKRLLCTLVFTFTLFLLTVTACQTTMAQEVMAQTTMAQDVMAAESVLDRGRRTDEVRGWGATNVAGGLGEASQDNSSKQRWDGELSSSEPAGAQQPAVGPRLKRVSEISLNLFDQPALGRAGELQIPKRKLLPAADHLSPRLCGATPKVVSWTAPDVAYGKLIFEEPELERHGFSASESRQHLISSATFFARSIALPVIVLDQLRFPCDNNLGWGIPGTCPR